MNALPPQGGTVCVLAGVYDESVLIDQRVAIRIHGCGPETRIRASVGADGTPLPAFLISHSSAIVLEDMAVESGPRSAVHITNARQITVRRCVIQMRDQPTQWQAMFSRGDDILIDSNIIEVLAPTGVPPEPTLPPETGRNGAPAGVNTPPPPVIVGSATRGGIQLAGGSDRVRVVHNIIRGGIWNGVTLGSLEAVESDGADDTPDRPASEDPCDPCKPVDLTDGDDPDGGTVRFLSAGDLYNIEIAGNRITDMGINGIGVVRFFDLAKGGDMMGVHGLSIADNVITRCMRRDVAEPSEAMESLVGYGGIALAKVSDLRILRNAIVTNGTSHLQPICGVFAIIVQGLILDDNRILDNGPRSAAPVAKARNGVRGGVHVWLVLPIVEQAAGSTSASSSIGGRRLRDGLPTSSMRDNVIVVPLGRSVTFFALGAVVVARNRLVTQGTTGNGLDVIAASVLIGNLGLSHEWTAGLILVLIMGLLSGRSAGQEFDFCRNAKQLGWINPTKPPSFWPPLARNWETGKTLVTENQITLDLIDEPSGFGLSSIVVVTLDDLGMTDNQCEISTTNVFVLTDAALLGGSVRVADNRFSETWMRAAFSAVSVGGMNTTTDNQSTHCLLARALLRNMRVFRDNLALVQAFCPDDCRDSD